ncbi:MAG: hypothetical protein JWR69_156 [Pedosphaera sp.]|nr:hypothetical protein [Pedosphaera sp.]
MNSEPQDKSNCCGISAYAAAVIGAFLIVAGLVWVMHHFTQPAPLGEDRAALRRKALVELRSANEDALNNYAWQDQAKGIVRLPVAQAMKVTEAEWQKNHTAIRSTLIARVEKATAAPPKAPEKPNQFD